PAPAETAPPCPRPPAATLRVGMPDNQQKREHREHESSDESSHLYPPAFFSAARAAATSANVIFFASLGGSKTNAFSLYDGARFHVDVDECCGRASSVVVVRTRLNAT